MANIRIDVPYTITDGSEVSFTAPCDCTAVTGLIVYHLGGSKVFTFRDAHGNDLTGIGNLFESGAIVKALLDVKNGRAYLQNADTNAYLEALFADMVKKSGDTLTSSLTVEAQSSGGQGYNVKKTVNSVLEELKLYINAAGLPSVGFHEDGTAVNRMVLNRDSTAFLKPVNIAGGGTNAATAEQALLNLGGISMKKVWENASLTSDFAAQKVPLTLATGDAVYVESVRSTDDSTISGRTLVYVGGLSGYLMGTTDQFALTRRKVTASTSGVTFTAFSSANTTSGTSNEIPYRIYVIKGVSK